jgi:hypothetical protein
VSVVGQGGDVDRSDWEWHTPYPHCFSHEFWKPTAIKAGGVYLDGYNGESEDVLEAFPKIPEDESALLYDLLSKIFVYEPSERVNAEGLLGNPWFHMDD